MHFMSNEPPLFANAFLMPSAVAEASAPERQDIADFARALIASRQNIGPRRLHAPAPDAGELALILDAAAAAPDHGLLVPWRFVIVPEDKRHLLGEAFALALIDRNPGATLEEVHAARDKAHRAPLLMLAIARLGPDKEGIPPNERTVSLGCAIQNMLLTAHALGYGAGLTSGQAMPSLRMRTLFSLEDSEQAVCFINIGTPGAYKPLRARPPADSFTSTL